MSQRLQKLGPRHHAAIRMRIAGMSNSEIQEAVGVRLRTLYLWFGDPLVQAEIDRQLERISDLVGEKLAVSGLRALDELVETLRKPLEGPVDAGTKLAVARELLDRCPSMPKYDPRAGGSCPSTRVNPYIGQPMEKLLERKRELEREMGIEGTAQELPAETGA